ncbi:hypothetical protein BHM03_00006730, partial [Ensete ventricosum]
MIVNLLYLFLFIFCDLNSMYIYGFQGEHMGHQYGRAALCCLGDTDGQGSGSNPVDPIHILDVFPEEICNDQNLTDKVLDCIYEPNLWSSRTYTGGSGQQIILNDIAYSSPIQCEEFVELNDLEDDSMNISYPFGEGFVTCPLLACHASFANRVHDGRNLHYGLEADEFFDAAAIQSTEPVLDNFNLQASDPLNTLSGDYASYQDAQDMVFHDASSEFLATGQDNSVYQNELSYSSIADPHNSDFDAEAMAFFDALDGGLENDIFSSLESLEHKNLSALSQFISEVCICLLEVDGGDGPTNTAIPELLYTNVGGNFLPALPVTDNQFVNDYENAPVAP